MSTNALSGGRSRFPRVTRVTGCLASLWLAFGPKVSAAADAAWVDAVGYRFHSVVPSTDRPAKATAGFRVRPSAETGIHFTNAIAATRMMENINLMHGSGVAAGDVDGDGRCDLFFCGIGGTNALYRNLGNWTFAEVTATAGLPADSAPYTGALLADVEGDGDLDLLVSSLGRGVRAFANQGDGRFLEVTQAVGLESAAGSTSLAMGDIDGDGDLDLYVCNYGAVSYLRTGGGQAQMRRVNGQWEFVGPHAHRLRFVDGRIEEVGEPDVLYRNDGQGRFQAVPWDSEFFVDEQGAPKPAPWDYGLSVQMRDINGDGAPDLYVCNDFQTVDRLWLNDGSGRFRAAPRLALRKQSFSSMGVDFADLDRDGHLDFLTSEMMGRTHARRLRNLTGLTPSYPAPGRIDNRPEVVRNTLQQSRGDGTYAEIANWAGVAATDWSWQPAFLDVDLDGWEDLLVVNGMPADVQDRDTLDHIRSLGRQTPDESRRNLMLYPPFLGPNLAFRNLGDLRFEDLSAAWGFDSTRVSQGIALADFDQDGDLDVVVNCLNATPLVCENLATAPRIAVRLRGRPPNPGGIGARISVETSGRPRQSQEVLAGGYYLSGSEPMRAFAMGTLTNRATLRVRWRDGGESVVSNAIPNRVYHITQPAQPAPRQDSEAKPAGPVQFRDLTDLLGHTHAERIFNDYERQPLLSRQLSQLGPGVAWVDLDADGHEELFIGCAREGRPALYRRQSDGGLCSLPPVDASWSAPDDLGGVAAWTWAEGRRAILVAMASYETGPEPPPPIWEVTLADDASGFRIAPVPGVPAMPASPGPLAAADVDGDGDLDLFVGGRVRPGAYPSSASSQLLLQEAGLLRPDPRSVGVLSDLGLVSGAVWSDVDLDGDPDLVLACEWGPVKVFRNEAGRLQDATDSLGLGEWTGWWSSVTTVDLDGDGRPDLVAGNWGLNDWVTASRARPLRLYFGDLASSGRTDLLEAYYPADLAVEMPVRSLSALGQALPGLRVRYPSHAAFSSAPMPEVVGALSRAALAVEATTLAHTVFFNRGDHFEPAPLPREAQLAPVFGVSAGDFDGDGHDDLVLAQNFFALRPEWPRLDAGRGLLLRGDGRGGLEPVAGQVSGLAVYGEQRGCASGDFNGDGRLDLVISQNGTATRLFENATARPALRVRLRGPRANPWGIGARLRLDAGEGWGPTREVRAGSGYWSQETLEPLVSTRGGVPRRLQVTWPGGRTTVLAVPTGARVLEVAAETAASAP